MRKIEINALHWFGGDKKNNDNDKDFRLNIMGGIS